MFDHWNTRPTGDPERSDECRDAGRTATGLDHLPALKRGDVLCAEPVASRNLLPGCSDGQHFTYRSVGPRDEPRTVTAAVHVPAGRVPKRGWPVLAFAHGTVGVGEHCPISFTLLGDAMAPVLTPWIRAGFAVVATDYVGLGTPGGHPYLDRVSAGKNVVDAVSAAHRVCDVLSASWVSYGGSQGGQAAASTAEFGAQRAPELDHRAAIALSTPVDVHRVVALAGPRTPRLPFAGHVAYLSYILAGVRVAHPEVRLDAYLTDRGMRLVDEAPWYGYAMQVERTKNLAVGDVVGRPLRGSGVVSALHEMSRLPERDLQVPLFLGYGVCDPVCPWPLFERYVVRLRRQAQRVVARRYVAGHQAWRPAQRDALSFALAAIR